MPDSAISFLRAVATWSAPEERHPAAVQTQTWCWNFGCGGALGFGDLAELLDGHWPIPFSMRASMSAGPILPITALSSTQ